MIISGQSPVTWFVYQWRDLSSSSFCPEIPIGVFITLYPEAPEGYLVPFITGRNEVVAKVIFLHLFVILFTGGGGVLSQCMLGYQPPRIRHQPPRPGRPPRITPPPPLRTRQTSPPPGSDPSGPGRLQHTVYERPVRILLVLSWGQREGGGVQCFSIFSRTVSSSLQ